MDLLTLKKDLEYKKSQRDKLLGKQELLMNDLKNLGFKKVQDAKKALEEMIDGINKKEIKLNKEIEKFQEKYEDLL